MGRGVSGTGVWGCSGTEGKGRAVKGGGGGFRGGRLQQAEQPALQAVAKI